MNEWSQIDNMRVATPGLEQLWLDEVRRGYTAKEIARRDGFSEKYVRRGIRRARGGNSEPGEKAEAPAPQRPPLLIPLFPVVTFTRSSSCPHKWKIRIGSIFCCMVCHKSGQDHHPLLQRDKLKDPKPPAREPEPSTTQKPAPVETRRERRARLFGQKKSA